MMGVSGSGKTSVGEALAARLGWPFEEGDTLHPAANIAKMKAGVPLDDADRRPWLDAVAGWIAERLAGGGSGVISCSALKRAYRDRLAQAGGAALRFVLLDVSPQVLRDRLVQRQGHFMPPSLLDSQLATLERPQPDERALVLPGDQTVEQNVAAVAEWLAAGRT